MSHRRRGSRLRNAIGIVLLAGTIIYGGVVLGLGISAFHNEQALSAHGVPAIARVTATSGYGRDTIGVTYPVDGHKVQGTVGADPSTVYRGEMIPVVYDPGSPQVVSLPGAVGDTGSAWGEVLAGAIVLLLFPGSFLLTLLLRRRRRRAAVRAALGD